MDSKIKVEGNIDRELERQAERLKEIEASDRKIKTESEIDRQKD